MTVGELLEQLHSRGVKLSVKEGKLTSMSQPGALTSELQEKISKYKSEILHQLSSQSNTEQTSAEIETLENQQSMTLSAAQQRIAMTSHTGSALSTAFLLKGNLHIEKLEKGLNIFIERHAILRSRFNLSGRKPTLTICSFEPRKLDIISIDNDSEENLYHALEKRQSLELNPEDGYCFEFELLQIAADRNVLFAAFSPLVFDGWSFDLFWSELTSCYAKLESDSLTAINSPEYSYADCANWLNDRIAKNQESMSDFWQLHLGRTLPADVFPMASEPQTERSTTSLPLLLPFDLTVKLRTFSKEHALTPQVVLLTTLFILAQRLRGKTETEDIVEGESDVVLGVAVEGRPHIALEKVVGPFANLILLRQKITPQQRFESFSKKVRDDFLSAHRHQEYPLVSHQVSSPKSSTKAFQIEFSFQQATGRSKSMGTLDISQLELRSGSCAIDLTFWVKDWGDHISGAVEFLSSAFESAIVEQWIRSYYHLLEQLLTYPEAPFSQFCILSQHDQRQMQQRVDRSEIDWLTDQYGHHLPYGVAGTNSAQDGIYMISPSSGTNAVQFAKQAQTNGDITNVPTSDTESRLEHILHTLLDRRVDTCVNFIDSGLNSLMTLRFISRCRDEIGVHLSISLLFKYSTIRLLARFIDSDGAQIDATAIVPLQSGGENPPLYCICGINLYQSLAIALGDEQSTYGIYVPGEHKLLANIEEFSPGELAKVYWRAIKQHHSEGPVSLLGFCFGGAIAYEIATLAKAESFEVHQLVLIDTHLAVNMKRRMTSRIAQLVPRKWKDHIKLRLSRIAAKSRTDDNSEEIETGLGATAMILSMRLDEFHPNNTYQGDTTQIDSGDPETNTTWIKTPLNGWEQILLGKVSRIDLQATHTTVLGEKCCREIAANLKGLLASTLLPKSE